MAIQEFQVVMLAGRTGSGIHGVAPPLAKPFIPVANRPLIWYPLKLLEEQGIGDLIIATHSTIKADLEAFVQQSFPKLNCLVIAVDDEGDADDVGTATVLERLADVITEDFFLLTCDLMGHADLKKLAVLHRVENAVCSMLLGRVPANGEYATRVDPQDLTWICADANDTSRVLNKKSGTEMSLDNEEFEISKVDCHFHPQMRVSTDLIDPHVYVFKPSVLDLLRKHPDRFQSIRHCLVPYLIRNQSTAKAFEWSGSRLESGSIGRCVEALNDSLAANTQPDAPRNCAALPPERPEHGAKVVFAEQLMEEQQFLRVRSRKYVIDANLRLSSGRPKEMLRFVPEWGLPPQMEGKNANKNVLETLMATDAGALGSGITLKKSVIGKGVKFGDRVKIVSSVVYDNVTIESGVTLHHCLVLPGAVIAEGVKVTDETVPMRSRFTANGPEQLQEAVDN